MPHHRFFDRYVCPYKLQQTCVNAGVSAASLDAWANEEFALLPTSAFQFITRLLNRIEMEAIGQMNLRMIKAVFLA